MLRYINVFIFLFFSLLIISTSPDHRSQSKKIIHNVYKFFKEPVVLKLDEKFGNIFRKTQQAAADACGYALQTIVKTCTEGDATEVASNLSFSSLLKKVSRIKPVTAMNNFNKDIMQSTVQEFYDRGKYLTCMKLKETSEQKIGLLGWIESLSIPLKISALSTNGAVTVVDF